MIFYFEHIINNNNIFGTYQTLYKLGARKVAVFGLGPIGCAPAEIAQFGTNGSACVDWVNNLVALFNNRLKPLVQELNRDLKDVNFTFINITSISSEDPSAAGELQSRIHMQYMEEWWQFFFSFSLHMHRLDRL